MNHPTFNIYELAEFWKQAYIAAIRAGFTASAKDVADRAVEHLKSINF